MTPLRHAELIADAADDEIDLVLQGLRPGVEGGHRRQHGGKTPQDAPRGGMGLGAPYRIGE